MTRIYNRVDVKESRRKLRNDSTAAEKLMWIRLRKRQIDKKRFLRQYSVGKYVIDFYCPEIKLAIEIDGETHCSDEEAEYDKNRQIEIEKFGITFLRFTNDEVFEKIDEVVMRLERWIEKMSCR